MENSNDNSLQIVKQGGIVKKIINFIKRLLYKENVHYISLNESNSNNKNLFLNYIKFKEDPDKAMLLKIQDDLEKKGINAENAYNLTKNLTDNQREKLINLYEEQIRNYETSLNNHKDRILAIRKQLAQ